MTNREARVMMAAESQPIKAPDVFIVWNHQQGCGPVKVFFSLDPGEAQQFVETHAEEFTPGYLRIESRPITS